MATSDGVTLTLEHLRGYVDYLRDLGVYDFYRADAGDQVFAGQLLALAAEVGVTPSAAVATALRGETSVARQLAPAEARVTIQLQASSSAVAHTSGSRNVIPPALPVSSVRNELTPSVAGAAPAAISVPFDVLRPVPERRVAPEGRAAALELIRREMGDCTRCPLAYAGRHSIVFGDGDPNASLMFVGEGPGADEDASGVPFIGQAGQLLNNMITAMGLKRAQVYVANVVKCRPPQNRVPEPVEANTCAQFLLQQLDVVQPRVVVALGATAATYLLGVKQPLASLRGSWHSCRGAKLAVTYHPAYLLRDPRQKGEAWKDLQRVMAELGLKGPARG